MKQIQISFSLGNLSTAHNSISPLTGMVNNGCTGCRVFYLFAKGYDTDVMSIVDQIEKLTLPNNSKRATVLLALGDLPYSWLADVPQERKDSLTDKQKDYMTWCNHFPLMESQKILFRGIIERLTSLLYVRDLLPLISFEVGFEPDSGRRKWGTTQEFIDTSKFIVDTLRIYTDRPIFHFGATTDMIRDNVGKLDWLDYIDSNPIFNQVGFSFSHYVSSSRNPDFDYNDNDYPIRTFSKGAIMTEYNSTLRFQDGSLAEAMFNSPQWGAKFVIMLKWAYNHNIGHIYIHPLTKYAKEENGKLGLYIKNPYQTGGYTVTQALTHFLNILQALKSTNQKDCPLLYEPTATGIRGQWRNIDVDGDNYVIA